MSKFKYLYCFMSIGRGDGITLHKITNVPTLIAKKTRHMDPDSLEMQDPNPYLDPNSMNPDPQHFWAGEYCSYTVFGRH